MTDSDTFDEIAREVRHCTLCRLHQGRTQTVPGVGSTRSGILLIGEAPGKDEDRRGEPFVGMAGRKLDMALGEAGLDRSSVFITNVVKCRPSENRSPRADEMRACRPYLMRQIAVAEPSVIVTLGGIGLRSLMEVKGPLRDYVGGRLVFKRVPVIATYHPAARRPAVVERLVEDLRRAREIAKVT